MARRALHGSVVVLLAGVAAACGGSGGSPGASTTTSEGERDAPPAIAAARTSRSCSSLPDDQYCDDYDTIEGWFHDGSLSGEHVAGAVALVENGCVACHVYRDIGRQTADAPDLTHVGAAKKQPEITQAIVCPDCAGLSDAMPAFDKVPRETIDNLAAFLAASR